MADYLYKVNPIQEAYKFYRKYKPYIFKRLDISGRPREDMEDIYSESIFTLVAAAKRWNPAKGASLNTFLFRNLLGYLHTVHRREINNAQKFCDIEEEDNKGNVYLSYINMLTDAPVIDSHAELMEAFSKLTPLEQIVLGRCYGIDCEKLTRLDSAKLLGITPRQLDTKILHAKEKLKGILEQHKIIGERLNYEA